MTLLGARPPPDRKPTTTLEFRGLSIAAVLAALTFARVAAPLGAGLFLGALVAFTLRPLHQAGTRAWGRPALSAFACAALAWVVVAGGIGGLVYLLLDRSAALSLQLPAALAHNGPIDRSANAVSARLGQYGVHSAAIDQHLHHAIEDVGMYAAGLAGKAASTALALLVAMCFMVLTTYVVLLHWARLAHWTEALLPLRPLHTRWLIRQLQALGREAMLGTLILGFVQGFLAWAGYAASGAPQPGFFGAMTAVASTVPALGTFLVWAPIGAYLIGSGHPVSGCLELAWGFLVVVTLSDGFIRPKVVGRRVHLGMLPTLIGLFGGLELFGFIGLLIGPTFIGLALAVLRLYAWERAAQRRQRRRAARAQPPSWDP